MPELHIATPCQVSAEVLWRWLRQPGALARMIPAASGTVIERADPVADGALVHLRLPVGPFSLSWMGIHQMNSSFTFVDRMISGPFAEWVHEHRVEPGPGDTCVLHDTVRWRSPRGMGWLMDKQVRGDLQRMFAWRRARLDHDLARLPTGRPYRIALSGAGGLVGRTITALATTRGDRVLSLQRRTGSVVGISYDPVNNAVDTAALQTCDAVIHLAGESVSQRWTPAAKQRIRHSRIDSTGLLARTLAQLPNGPRVLVIASGVSFPGDRGAAVCDETTCQGQGFLPQVVADWEAAAKPALDAGIRVVHLRLGVVLAADGGVMGQLLPVFRLGLGGRISDGRAFFPWISVDDAADLFLAAVRDPFMHGVYNAVAPQAIDNQAFTTAFAAHLRRPALFPVPGWVLTTLMGQMARETILCSINARPARLLEKGWNWRHPTVQEALSASST